MTAWVYDVNARDFRDRIREEVRAINESDRASGIMDWIESVSIFDDAAESLICLPPTPLPLP